MKFYEALEQLLESKIVEGVSQHFIINKKWNGLNNNKRMTVHVRDQQEDCTYYMTPYLQMVIETEFEVTCLPWTPSCLDIFSNEWDVETIQDSIVAKEYS